ncbi:unnamed protein product [Callosobruchus maculatus]|nr:unnamed protein product [Callosobruchus maculatus]
MLDNDIDIEKYNITYCKILKSDQDVLGKQAAIIGIERAGANRLMGARLTVIHTTTCQELCKKNKNTTYVATTISHTRALAMVTVEGHCY